MSPLLPTSVNGAAPAMSVGGQAGSGQPTAAQGGLHRARLTCNELNDSLEVNYNPTQVTLRKAAVHLPQPQQGAAHGASPGFINTHTRTLSFALTLEAWSTGTDVVAAVNKLQSWLNPTQASLQPGNTPAPPTIAFEWWNDPEPFVGVITQADATYTVFGLDGRPVRASVTLAMSELPQPPARQNPTSGSPGGGQTILVRDGDSLASIAYRRYGDPALWRGLAVANRIVDPTALTPGQRLVIPAPASARELAR